MAELDFNIDERVDITDVVCPMTFVKAKVAMEELEIGQVLAVTMNDGEPVQNVPRSFKEEGQQILKLIDNENGTYDLIVKKVEEYRIRNHRSEITGGRINGKESERSGLSGRGFG